MRLHFNALEALFAFTLAATSYASTNFSIERSEVSFSLPQGTVTTIHKGSRGFLWVGTQQGLVKVDGTQGIQHSDGRRLTDISSIESDKFGELWLASRGSGIFRFNSVENKFIPLDNIYSGENFSHHQEVTSLAYTNNGVMWYGTEHSGLGAFVPGMDNPLSWVDRLFLEIGNPEILDIEADSHGRVWVASSKGLHFVDYESRTLRTVDLSSHGVTGRKITSLHFSPNGNLWGATSLGEIFRFRPGVTRSLTNFSIIRQLENHLVADITLYNGHIWLATDQGLMAISPGAETTTLYTTSNSRLANNHVVSLFPSDDGLWVGTYQGLDLLIDSRFDRYSSKNSNINDEIMALTIDHIGGTWVGTYAGLYYLAPTSNHHRSVEEVFPEFVLSDNRVMAIAPREDELWIGTRGKGLLVLDKRRGKRAEGLQRLNQDGMGITDITHINESSTIVSTFQHGVYLVTHNKKQAGKEAFDIQNLLSESGYRPVYQVYMDSAGRIYLVAETSVFISTDRANSFREYRYSYKSSTFGFSPRIIGIREDTRNTIWFGTIGQGLFYASNNVRSGDSIILEPFRHNHLLSSGAIYSFEFDHLERVWVAGSSGLSRIDPFSGDAVYYSPSQGIQGKEFNFAASFTALNGTMLFGGTKGYNKFDPQQFRAKPAPSKIKLLSLEIPGRENSHITSFREGQLIHLSHQDSVIIFEFSVLDFVDLSRRMYRYKLHGQDLVWNYTKADNKATFTNLPPGTYTFEVQGANSAGTWNHDGATLDLIVHPPPWRTVWAYWIYAGMFLTFLWIMRRAYDAIGQVAHATEHAERMEETATLAMDQLQDQMQVQTDMADALQEYSELNINLIQNVLSYYSEKESESPTAQELRARCTLRLHALHLLDSCIYHHGALLYVNMHDFSERVIDDLLERHGLDEEAVIVTNDVTGELFPAETGSLLALILYELLENCFQHAFHAQKTVNFIMLRLNKSGYDATDQPVFALEVADNGPGVHADEIPALMQGPGMRFVKSLAERIDASVHVDGNNGLDVEISRSV